MASVCMELPKGKKFKLTKVIVEDTNKSRDESTEDSIDSVDNESSQEDSLQEDDEAHYRSKKSYLSTKSRSAVWKKKKLRRLTAQVQGGKIKRVPVKKIIRAVSKSPNLKDVGEREIYETLSFLHSNNPEQSKALIGEAIEAFTPRKDQQETSSKALQESSKDWTIQFLKIHRERLALEKQEYALALQHENDNKEKIALKKKNYKLKALKYRTQKKQLKIELNQYKLALEREEGDKIREKEEAKKWFIGFVASTTLTVIALIITIYQIFIVPSGTTQDCMTPTNSTTS